MIRSFHRGTAGRFIFSMTALMFMMAPQAHSGALVDAATKAEEKAASGDAAGAYALMREAVGNFAETLPFTLAKGIFVKAVPTAYGIYEPRPNNVFRPGETLITYLEPVGLTWKSTTDGAKQQTRFTVDYELMNAKGDVIAAQKTFGNFSFTGFFRNQEIFTHLTLDISGAPAGDYVLRYIVNDVDGSRTAKLEQPFTIK